MNKATTRITIRKLTNNKVTATRTNPQHQEPKNNTNTKNKKKNNNKNDNDKKNNSDKTTKKAVLASSPLAYWRLNDAAGQGVAVRSTANKPRNDILY